MALKIDEVRKMSAAQAEKRAQAEQKEEAAMIRRHNRDRAKACAETTAAIERRVPLAAAEGRFQCVCSFHYFKGDIARSYGISDAISDIRKQGFGVQMTNRREDVHGISLEYTVSWGA